MGFRHYLTRGQAGFALATILWAGVAAGQADAGVAPPEPPISIRTGPDFFVATERVRGDFTCGDPPGETVSGFFEYRRSGEPDIEDISRTDQLLVLNARGRNVSPSVIADLNAHWQAGGRGAIVDIRVFCSSDMKRMRWDIRYWRSAMVAAGNKGYASVIVVTDEDGNEVFQQDDGNWK